MDEKIRQRLLSKITVDPAGCWVWTGSLYGASQYGAIYMGKERYRRAHRVSYEIFVGELRPGLCIDHLCRNKRCVNPAHLEQVTQAENVRRAFAYFREAGISFRRSNQNGRAHSKGRLKRTHCFRGHELAPPHLYVYRGVRHCKTCQNNRRRERNAKRRALINLSDK